MSLHSGSSPGGDQYQYETEEDLRCAKRMTEIAADPERTKRLMAANQKNKRAIRSIADLNKAAARSQDDEAIDDPQTGLTSLDGVNPHRHGFEVDDEGNGKTTETLGAGPDHVHTVDGWLVKLAGQNDRHKHSIPERQAPA